MIRKNKLGRLTALILAMILAFTSMPLSVYAEDGQEISVENQSEDAETTESTGDEIMDVDDTDISQEETNDSVSNNVSDNVLVEIDAVSDNDIDMQDDNQEEQYQSADEEHFDIEYVEMYEYAGGSTDSLFEMPYVSTYYFNPKPSINDNIQIPLYLTDYEQSEYLNDNTTKKVDLIYKVDGVSNTIKGIPLGDYTLTIGKLSEGMHYFSVQVVDTSTGMKSHELFNDLWVVDPAKEKITDAQTYKMTASDLKTYGINNQNSTNAADCINTRDGLNKLFADKQAAGYRKIILLAGTYRINGEDTIGQRKNSIFIPAHFTVDMNGSTFKLDTIKTDLNEGSNTSGSIVKMDDVVDAHLINGTLEGDRFERKALGLETKYMGEAINTVTVNGGKYCSLEDLKIKNTTGHTVFTQGFWGPLLSIDSYTNVAIVDGKEIAGSNYRTSCMVDLTKIIDYEPDVDYMYVGHPEGYRGIKGDTAFIYVSFYNSNQEFMKTVAGMQYRKMQIPEGAKYARVSLLGTDVSTTKYDGNTLSIYVKHYGEYNSFKNLDFIDTRTTAMSPSTCNNLLIDGCTYTRVGSSITPSAVDLEDGWEECQDVYYRNNQHLEAAIGNTATVIDNTGYNHVYENCTNHSFEIRYRVIGAVLRNMNDKGTSIGYQIGTKKRGKFGRIYNNDCGAINVAYKAYENSNIEPVNFKIKNCTITSIPGNTNSYTFAVPDKVIYENCTFPCFGGSGATFVGCTIQLTENAIWSDVYFYDCTFLGMETGKVNLSGASYANRVFENCTFTGKTPLINYSLVAGTFKNCSFEDLRMIACTRDSDETILFEDCTINSTADVFIDIGPFAYSDPSHINLIFRNCAITHTGRKFINQTAKTSAGSQVLFDGCTINKQVDTSINPNLIKVINEGKLLDTSIKGYSVSLDGDISLNFYIQIPDDIHNNSSAVVHFILPNGTTSDVKVSTGKVDGSNSKTYIYSCGVPAAYMTGNVSAQVQILSNGKPAQLSETYTCSVKSYADAVISNSTKYGDDKVAMVKAMLNYGAYAQQYFGVNTGNMANSNMYTSATDPVLNFSQNLSSQQISGISTKGDLEFYGASLVCKGETNLKLYFGSKSGTTLLSGRYTVKAVSGGKTRNCSATITNNMYVVTLTGIAAAELDDTYQFTITDTKNSANAFTFGYSPMNYIANAQKSSDKALVYLTRAIYYYNQAANKVF